MPVCVQIDQARQLVISTFFGEVTSQELTRGSSLIADHPDFEPKLSEILDFTDVRKTSWSTDAIRTMAETKAVFDPSATHIVIAPADFHFGLARMIQAIAEDSCPHFAIVRSRDEAYRLCGLEEQIES